MSNDNTDDLIRTKMNASEGEYRVAPQHAEELWTRLETKRAKDRKKVIGMTFLKAAAALLLLVGISFAIMQRSNDQKVARTSGRSEPTIINNGAPDNGDISKHDSPGNAISTWGNESVGMLSREQIVAQLENVDEPLAYMRSRIEGLAVQRGRSVIKDRVEF